MHPVTGWERSKVRSSAIPKLRCECFEWLNLCTRFPLSTVYSTGKYILHITMTSWQSLPDREVQTYKESKLNQELFINILTSGFYFHLGLPQGPPVSLSGSLPLGYEAVKCMVYLLPKKSEMVASNKTFYGGKVTILIHVKSTSFVTGSSLHFVVSVSVVGWSMS